MNKQSALKMVNPLFAIAFVFQAFSGFAMGFDHARYELWEDAHGTCAWALLALFASHVWLNWGWLKSNTLSFLFKRKGA